MEDNLLSSLAGLRWHIAFRTFGNNHATLIGLIVDWWITGSLNARWALEGGPSFGQLRGGGICDAILGEGQSSRGVVEVEGSRHEETILKIGKFFSSEMSDLQTLEFGIFLAYSFKVEGYGTVRGIATQPLGDYIELGKTITRENPGKQPAILVLDKKWERQFSGPRARNEYYMGRPIQVRGVLVRDGNVTHNDLIISA